MDKDEYFLCYLAAGEIWRAAVAAGTDIDKKIKAHGGDEGGVVVAVGVGGGDDDGVGVRVVGGGGGVDDSVGAGAVVVV